MAEIRLKNEEILSNQHYTLKKVNFEIKKKNGEWEEQNRELYDHGNAVTVLLYNKQQQTIIVTQQFRIATYLNGNKDGMLIEACAGLLEDNENPDDAVKREIEEETGYKIGNVKKVYETYMSAGSLTELLYYYVAEYDYEQKVGKGGGLEEDQEEILVLEIPFEQALTMMKNGEIKDAKTLVLLQYAALNKLL
jgi:GDP-mannose pyrophosphatase NudK